MPRCRWGAWATPGMLRMLRCSSRPTRRGTSPRRSSWSTAASPPRPADPQAEGQAVARIPYADLASPEIKPLVDKIVAERGSVLHLYQMLLHSPPVAAG